MINKLSEIIVRKTSWKKSLMFLMPTLGIYVLMLSYSIPKVMEYANGMKILDLMPMGYSSEYALKLLETLDETGRNAYLWQQIPLDMIYPVLFAITFSLLLANIFKKAFSQNNNLQSLCALPVAAGFFDYLENIGIIIMIQIFPTFYGWLANVTNVFSIVKSILTTISFLLIIIGLVILGMRKFKKRIVNIEN